MYQINDVIQFNEKHKWVGCFGFVIEVKQCVGGDVRYMVGVPIPEKGTACIFTMQSAGEIEYIGRPVMVLPEEDEE